MSKRSLKAGFASALLLTVAACGGGDAAVTVEPLPAGAGLYFTDGNTGFADATASFYKLNEISGDTALQPTSGGSDSPDSARCPAMFALDARPDGVVLAVARRTAAIYEADPRTTVCKLLAALPEVMAALAVRADGRIFTVSDTTNKLYQFDAQAQLIAAAPLLCPATLATCKVNGIDFAPDGTLYAIGPLGQWGRLDISSAQVTPIKSGAAFSDDFDIDTLGRVRGLANGEFRSFDLAGNPTGHAINVFGGTAFATGVVYR